MKEGGGQKICEGGHWFARGLQLVFEINHTRHGLENIKSVPRKTTKANNSHESLEEGAMQVSLCFLEHLISSYGSDLLH